LHHPSENIRALIAKHPNTTAEQLQVLSTDKNIAVREEVASNVNTPLSVIALLSEDVYERVVASIASSPNTPLPILHRLAENSNYWIMAALITNKKTTLAVKNVMVNTIQRAITDLEQHVGDMLLLLNMINPSKDRALRLRIKELKHHCRNVLKKFAQSR
jgi:hypothetical protein